MAVRSTPELRPNIPHPGPEVQDEKFPDAVFVFSPATRLAHHPTGGGSSRQVLKRGDLRVRSICRRTEAFDYERSKNGKIRRFQYKYV
jgi:hypothetical protein